MIQCDSCGYPVINGMHTCPNCLAEMPDEIVAPIPVEEEVMTTMKMRFHSAHYVLLHYPENEKCQRKYMKRVRKFIFSSKYRSSR